MFYRINEIIESTIDKGFHLGLKVAVIRFAGCNLHCDFCESDYSIIEEMNSSEILDELKGIPAKFVVISGGEPTLQDLKPLLNSLKTAGYWIALETNGTILLNGITPFIDYLITSPKEYYIIKNADEVVIINNNKIDINLLLKVEKEIEALHYYLCPLQNLDNQNLKETLLLLNEINKQSTKKWELGVSTNKYSKPE